VNKAAIRAEARSASFRIAGVETAEECIGTLEPGARIVGLTKGQFSLLDLIRAVVRQTGPADVALSTWTMGIRDAENVSWMLESGQLRRFVMLTDRSFVKMKPDRVRRIEEVFGKGSVRVSRTHAKVALVRCGDWRVSIRSSMNLNRNRRWEQFDLDDNAEIFGFFDRWFVEMAEKMPEGCSPPGSVVHSVFEDALEDSRHKAPPVEESEMMRLARLGYTRTEIAARVGAALDGEEDDYHRGVYEIADGLREATISAALGGDKQARERAQSWVEQQLELL